MKASFLILVAAGLLLAGCGKSSSSSQPQGTSPTQATNTTASQCRPPSGGYLGALMQADKYAVKTIDVSYLNQAVQLFNTQEGRLPKDLNELMPNYVAKIPAAPYGSKIVYDRASGIGHGGEAIKLARPAQNCPQRPAGIGWHFIFVSPNGRAAGKECTRF